MALKVQLLVKTSEKNSETGPGSRDAVYEKPAQDHFLLLRLPQGGVAST